MIINVKNAKQLPAPVLNALIQQDKTLQIVHVYLDILKKIIVHVLNVIYSVKHVKLLVQIV